MALSENLARSCSIAGGSVRYFDDVGELSQKFVEAGKLGTTCAGHNMGRVSNTGDPTGSADAAWVEPIAAVPGSVAMCLRGWPLP